MNLKKLRPVIDIYEENAAFWKNHRAQKAFPEKTYLDWVLSQLSSGDELLDLGCGSGFPIADYFLRNGINVTGVDATEAMIKLAKADFPEGNWKLADMRTLDLKHEYSAIIAWDSFFHLNFAEQESMFPIFRAHLRPGGLLVFTSGPERGEAIGDMNGNPLYHSSLAPNEYRTLLAQNGFEVVEYHPEDKDCAGHTIWRCSANPL